MDPRRLELLLELSRLGSMRAVGEVMGVTTSTVSQQIAALADDAGTPLIEHHGRLVRLTPAGRRLAGHAVTILAAIEAARLDLDPAAEPAGTLRVAAFTTSFHQLLLPVVRMLTAEHPRVQLQINEYEPDEALRLLAADEIDLALTYDFNLAPASFGPGLNVQALNQARWALGLPAGSLPFGPLPPGASAPELFGWFREHDWIVNSRNTADEDVIRAMAGLAGFQPSITHRADSLDLVQDMIQAGLGVGLLPASLPVVRGVRLRQLRGPEVVKRVYSVTRHGPADWAPLALVLRLLEEVSGPGAPESRR